jgi:hypothetical protein
MRWTDPFTTLPKIGDNVLVRLDDGTHTVAALKHYRSDEAPGLVPAGTPLPPGLIGLRFMSNGNPVRVVSWAKIKDGPTTAATETKPAGETETKDPQP